MADRQTYKRVGGHAQRTLGIHEQPRMKLPASVNDHVTRPVRHYRRAAERAEEHHVSRALSRLEPLCASPTLLSAIKLSGNGTRPCLVLWFSVVWFCQIAVCCLLTCFLRGARLVPDGTCDLAQIVCNFLAPRRKAIGLE